MFISSYQPIYNFSLGNSSVLITSINRHVIEEASLARGFGGGFYDFELNEFVPYNPIPINKIYNCVKNYFSRKIGDIYSFGEKLGLNSATTHKALRKDAEVIAPKFIGIIRKICEETQAVANFGPGDRFALKSEGSLKRKIITDSRKEKISLMQATQKISDALRGSIIVDSEEQIQSIAKKVNDWVRREGGQSFWKNAFQEERDDGYIGIHGKILLPFTTAKGEKRQIRCELQLHFHPIADGSFYSPKERMHILYKYDNGTLTSNRSLLFNVISKLSFLSGMASIGTKCMVPEYLINLCSRISVVSKNLCDDRAYSNLCEGNLGIARHQMPQVSGQVKKDFLSQKKGQGIKVEKRSMPADELTPVQNELSRKKVEELVESFGRGSINPCEKAILVSSKNEDGKQYVIDGHHRYAACRLAEGKQDVIAIDDNVTHLISELETFPGVRRSSIENLDM